MAARLYLDMDLLGTPFHSLRRRNGRPTDWDACNAGQTPAGRRGLALVERLRDALTDPASTARDGDRAWFAVFPAADRAFYLLAMVNAGLALWIMWRALDGPPARYLRRHPAGENRKLPRCDGR